MGIFRGTGGSGEATTDVYASRISEYATTATNKASEAESSATDAEAAQAAAESAKTAAQTAQTNAETAETNAETAETNAETAETAAESAQASAETAKTAAETAKTAAETAKTAAETAETNAETAEANASTHATTATTKASEAATSATSAATSATSASTSATSASTSATAAQTAQTAAEAAQTAAEAAQEAIDGLYLGTATSNPTVDLNGDAVTAGDWYFNTTDSTTRVYDGSTWNTINPDLIGDATPQLGGDLDLNSNDITGTGNLDITGSLTADSVTFGASNTFSVTSIGKVTANNYVSATSFRVGANTVIDSSRNATFVGLSLTGDATFGDSDKAIFGAGSDLQIYHNGTESFIADVGTGPLNISGGGAVNIKSPAGENMIVATGNDSVDLYHDNSRKLRTASTGIDVIGTVTADGLTVDGTTSVNANSFSLTGASPVITITDSDTSARNIISGSSGAGNLFIGADEDNGSANSNVIFRVDGSEKARVTDDGNVGVGTNSPAFALGSGIEIQRAGTATLRLQDTTNTANGELRSGPSGIEFFSGAYGVSGDPFTFSVSGTKALTINSSRNVGIGTSSPSDLLDISANGTSAMRLSDSSSPATYAQITSANGTLTLAADAGNAQTASNIQFEVDGSEAMRINNSGYLGIGTTAPDKTLVVRGDGAEVVIDDTDTTDTPRLRFRESGSTSASIRTNASNLIFDTGSTERIRIDSSGNVGIGTNAPQEVLQVNGNIRMGSGAPAEIFTNNSELRIGVDKDNNNSTSNLTFYVNNSEKMRLEASGNFLVGTTSLLTADESTNTGFRVNNNGNSVQVRDGNTVQYINRLNSDGAISTYQKDGDVVGNIGVDNSDNLFIQGNSTHGGLQFGTSSVAPHQNGALADNVISLGTSGNRFKYLYLSSGAYLGGTGGANLLDDYEEGTWTPVVSDAATGGNTATYTTNLGRYRKVGNMITVSCKLVNIDRTGMTTGNAIYIQGLPFTAGAGDLGQQQGALFCNGINLDTNCRSMCVHTSSSKSYLLVREIRDNQSSVVTNVGKIATGGTADIFATITYFN